MERRGTRGKLCVTYVCIDLLPLSHDDDDDDELMISYKHYVFLDNGPCIYFLYADSNKVKSDGNWCECIDKVQG